ncbi:hypothetical protein [Pseudopelagicola sp. nBUS_19]|uniref:hypothetical protein n=1 Tax=Pseudopelagicola sp. nBUS_19 TaxID=3395316 RepID=UPI003EC0FA17
MGDFFGSEKENLGIFAWFLCELTAAENFRPPQNKGLEGGVWALIFGFKNAQKGFKLPTEGKLAICIDDEENYACVQRSVLYFKK